MTKRTENKYLKCSLCRWVFVIDPNLKPQEDCCRHCGASNKFFVSTDGKKVPPGATIIGIAAPVDAPAKLNTTGTVED